MVQQLTQAINVDQRSSHREESNASRHPPASGGGTSGSGMGEDLWAWIPPFRRRPPTQPSRPPGPPQARRSLRLTRPVRPAFPAGGTTATGWARPTLTVRRSAPPQQPLSPQQPPSPHQPRPRPHWSSCGDNPCTRSSEREFSIPTGFRPVAQSAPAGLTSPPANTPATPPPPVSKIHSPAAKSVVFADFAARTRSTPPPARPRPHGTLRGPGRLPGYRGPAGRAPGRAAGRERPRTVGGSGRAGHRRRDAAHWPGPRSGAGLRRERP